MDALEPALLALQHTTFELGIRRYTVCSPHIIAAAAASTAHEIVLHIQACHIPTSQQTNEPRDDGAAGFVRTATKRAEEERQ